MIDFPLNPTHGNTYSYLDIQYTFHKPTAAEGYWRVSTPASVGVATPTEINEGTDNAKYVTPQGLDNSEYVREDKTSGETVLNFSGSKRLKAGSTGVEVTGKLVLDGDTEKGGVKVGKTLLWIGAANNNETFDLSQDILDFDAVVVDCHIHGTSGFVFTGNFLSDTMSASQAWFSASDANGEVARITLAKQTTLRYQVNMSSASWSPTLRRVYGIKYA